MSEDVPPARQCTMPTCSLEATEQTGAGLCPKHAPGADVDSEEFNQQDPSEGEDVLVNDNADTTVSGENGEERREDPGSPDVTPTPEAEEPGVWNGADFTEPESGVYPPALLEREQWMGRKGKLPYAPWADRDHPEAEADEDARWKWGLTENYVDGERIGMAEIDPQLDGRVFLQREDDPFVFVDGDDVRCPETGEVHPEFVRVLEELGATYADVSTSGAGVHANYRGGLPDEVKQATFAIDEEPWGANEDLPEIEIYDGKHVCVTTGEHVPGTPTDVQAWDADAVESVLDEFDQLPTERPENPAAVHEAFEAAEYDADATEGDETATDIRDVFAALDRLDARRVAEQTVVHSWNDSASTSGDKRAFAPTWGPSANGTANVVDREIWQDTGGGGYGGPVVMALIDAGEVRPSSATPRVSGETWWKGIEHLRSLGYDIPEYEPDDGAEHTAVLPDSDDLDTATSGWDWRSADDGVGLEITDARERTVDAIADAYDTGGRRLIEALPTMGKSYGAVKAAQQTGEQITVLTGRGEKEQYQQFKQWCEEFGLSYKRLPSFTQDCPTAAGVHGDEWRETVMDWYRRGATPQAIHNAAEYALDRPLPCQVADDGTHIDCAYRHVWDFDPDDYDVLIGHYTHAHTDQAVSGRTVVFDEFPGSAYETQLGGGQLQGAVSYWLSTPDADEIPFDDYTDLIENRGDQGRRSEALTHFLDEDDGPAVSADEGQVFDDAGAHAAAPLAVFTLLAGEDLGNGFESADLQGAGTGAFDRQHGAVSIIQPPALDYASGVVALDGTPTKRMWELTLGSRLNHRPVLQDAERAEYVRDALNLNLVRTTDAVKPYNSADHVTTDQDAALLEAIAETHGQCPAVITSATAEGEYDAAGLTELIDETKHYGNVLGSNEFKETRLGAVVGSNHYGDQFIKKWGAYAGQAVERNEEKGAGLSYGAFGDDVLQHMREHDTLQAAMRFGRDGNGAVVYVHTDTLPDWVPLVGEGRVVTTWSDGMKDVLAALEHLGGATTAEIADHPDVDVGRRQVLEHLETLRERGVLSRDQDPDDGRRVLWQGDDVHRVNEHGDVDFDELEVDDLTADEVAELARSSIYTWEFRNFAAEAGDPPSTPGDAAPARGTAGVNGRGAPPDDAD